MLFKKLLSIDLSGLPKSVDISWHSIKNKLEYLLNTRNKVYSARSNLDWENLLKANENARDQHFKSLIKNAKEEEQLRISITNSLSICNNKDIMPDNIANFINLQDNFSKFLGCENSHISNILLYIEWLVEAMSLIEKRVLSKINDKKQQTELMAQADAFVLEIRKYSIMACTNILIRLETMSKHGFVDNFGMMAIFDLYEKPFSVNNLKISLWDQSEFESYYLFVLKNGDSKQIERLKAIKFEFGKIYINSDNKIAAYPSIYKEGELLLQKPWCSWFRYGAYARYALFKDGYLQIELNAKVKLAESLNDENTINTAIEALRSEYIRVANIRKRLPRYIYPRENELCDRWQKYLTSKMYDIKNVQLLKLNNIISCDNDLVDLALEKGALSSYMKKLELVRPLSDIGLIYLYINMKDKIFKIIITLIINVLMRNNIQSKKYMLALENIFSKDILSYIIGSDLYDDALLLFRSLKGIDDAEKLFAVITKYITNEEYGSLLQNYFNIDIGNNKSTILMQAYINRCFSSSKDIPDLQKFYGTVHPYLRDFKVADTYYENLDLILSKEYKSSDEFLQNLSNALSECKDTIINHKLSITIKNHLDNKLRNCSYDRAYLDMILEYGSSSLKHKYCLEIFNAKIKAGFSLHDSLIACDYYNIANYDTTLAYHIRSKIQAELVVILTTNYAGAHLSKFKSLFAGITKDNSIMQDFDVNHQEHINSFIAMKFADTWSVSASYVISLFASDIVKQQYHVKLINSLALEPLYNDEMHDAFSYIKELNEDSNHYWSCFGLLDHNIKSVIDHVAFAIKTIGYKDDRINFLSFVFANDSLVEFYKLTDLKENWKRKKHSIFKQEELELLVNNAKNGNVDDLLKVIDFIELHKSDIDNIEPTILNMIDLIWDNFEKIIKESLITDDIDELLIYKDKVVDKLLVFSLSLEKNYELKFLSWLATMGQFIKSSSLIFLELSQDLPGKSINLLILYLYNIGHYSKHQDSNVNKNMAQYSKYNSRGGIVSLFCENISCYEEYVNPGSLNEIAYDIPEAVSAPQKDLEDNIIYAKPVLVIAKEVYDSCNDVSPVIAKEVYDSCDDENSLKLHLSLLESSEHSIDRETLEYLRDHGMSAEVKLLALSILDNIDTSTDSIDPSYTTNFFSN